MKIHVYPGMGATSEMYSGLWQQEDFAYHNWPQMFGKQSIKSYTSKVIEEHGICYGDIIIGSSLGGIIACEVANQIEVKQLILIGSAVSKDEINSFLKLIHPLVDYAPLSFIKALTGKIPNELSAMFSQSDPQFIRTMCKAIFEWEGLNDSNAVTRIHGRKDRVIPLPLNCAYQVEGGHLIAMTHPQECIGAIKETVPEI